jgi:hypothetical protein
MLPGEELLEALQTAAARDADDFFMDLIGEPVMDLDGAPYGGSRHPVEANPDGRLFARFHLDLGMGDIQREPYEWTEPRVRLTLPGWQRAVSHPSRERSTSRRSSMPTRCHNRIARTPG